MTEQALTNVIDYDLTDGVEILSRCFTPDTCGQVEELEPFAFVPPEQYDSPPTATDPDVVAIRELFEKPYKGGPKGRQVAYSILGDDSDSGEITALFMNWGRCRDESMIREIAGILRMSPGMRLLVSDHPNTGESDPLPRAVSKEVARSGRHTAFAEVVLGGLASAFEDYVLTIRARSEGGLVGLEVAAQLERPVKAISVFDSPGSRELRVGEKSNIAALETIALLRGMRHYFLDGEAKHALAYASVPGFDPEAARIRSEGISHAEVARSVARLILEKRFMTQVIRLPLSMARGKLGEAIGDAMPNVTGNMTFISPIYSELNRPGDVKTVFEEVVKEADPSELPGVVRQLIINGTHAFGTSTPDALTVVENHALHNNYGERV
ncbi:MAG TPA: hypothetical protein VK694_06320 [Verrucomicrobiae bacterium]|nr:hypothetical protein [Verrucomicrobiae bacterium]